MDLHRAGKRPDWLKVATGRRNSWQRLASGTGGIITVGNALTIIGFALVISGLAAVLYDNYWLAAGLLFAGRCCDLLDGWAANRTGTKSPLGEKLDAGFDKLATALAVVVLVTAGIVPWWAAVLVVVPHVAIALMSAVVLSRGKVLHPSQPGKYSMAAAWFGLGSFVVWRALEVAGEFGAQAASYALIVLSCLLGMAAVRGYWYQYKKVERR